MLMVVVDVLSLLVLVGWVVVLLVMVAFIAMAVFEFLRVAASAAASAGYTVARGCERWAIRHSDTRFLRHIGIRR